jgi:hypothetical protein
MDHNIELLQKVQAEGKLLPKDSAEFLLISQGKQRKDISEHNINVTGVEKGGDPLGLVVASQLFGSALKGRNGGQNKKGGKRRDKEESEE